MMKETASAPPSPLLLLLEMRAIAEFGAFLLACPLLRRAPRGDGHSVLVVPGLGASDISTQPLRTLLRDLGYRTHGWKQGMNRGPREGVEPQMQQRLAELAARDGRKVSLIGWSLGGVMARELARSAPEHTRCVITLGSAFAGVPTATNARAMYEVLSGRSILDWPDFDLMKSAPPVPSTAIFSRSDGIVAWQGCLESESPQTENIEVESSHSGLGHNPAALYAVADRLAQPEGQWKPFERTGLRSFIYRDPRRNDSLVAA